MYRALASEKIADTLQRLHQRVAERFPHAGLTKVCEELTRVARENDRRAGMLARPNYVLRTLSGIIIASGLALIGYVATHLEVRRETETVAGLLQGIDAGFNIVLVMGAAVIFLVTLESRWKRQRAIADLDELRSIIHVIDMHQLTKDPVSTVISAAPTASSPKRTLTPVETVRYLDYCSEMLSLAAKVAAVYAQSSKDPVVVEAASDLQQLTANLSTKIWQKINIAQRGIDRKSELDGTPRPAAGADATPVPATPAMAG